MNKIIPKLVIFLAITIFSLNVFSQTSCVDISPNNSYYVDGNNLCGTCSDNNPGTVTQPWCTIERAFDKSKSTYLKKSQALYIRSGIYRFDQPRYDTLTQTWSNFDLDGTQNAPTIISGYPNEVPKIYLSENIKGWQKYTVRNNTGIYDFNWANYVRTNYYYFIKQNTFNPQSVFVDGVNPIPLQQVNSSISAPYTLPYIPLSYRTSQADMVAGDFYFESNPSKSNFGMLYIWLPNGEDPNTKEIEVSLDYVFPIKGSWITLSNFAIRFAGENSWAAALVIQEKGDPLTTKARNVTLDNLDISYNSRVGLNGRCYDCVIKNSNISNNGSTGTSLIGDNTVYENNLFEKNNFRRYPASYNCGGGKLITNLGNNSLNFNDMVIRKNVIRDNIYCVGMWVDALTSGQLVGTIIEQNLFVGSSRSWGVSVEITNGSTEKPTIIRDNIFTGPSLSPQIMISSSHNNKITNNLFYNSSEGIVLYVDPRAQVGDPTRVRRMYLKNNDINGNIFVKVTTPTIIIPNTQDGNVTSNTSNNNLFFKYGPESELVPEELKDNIVFCNGFDAVTASNCTSSLTQWNSLGYDTSSKIIQTTPSESKIINLIEKIKNDSNATSNLENIKRVRDLLNGCNFNGVCAFGEENNVGCPSDCRSIICDERDDRYSNPSDIDLSRKEWINGNINLVEMIKRIKLYKSC